MGVGGSKVGARPMPLSPSLRAWRSLAETYERLEADKKRQVQKKRKCTGPTIRYYSGTMPLISELGYKEENVDVEG